MDTEDNTVYDKHNPENTRLLHHRTHDVESEQLLPGRPPPTRTSVPLEFYLPDPPQHKVDRAFYCLYASHALARWAWRTWEFSVALILMKLHPESLLLVSAYGLLDNLVRLVLGSFVGQYIDRSDRLRGAVGCYGIQNICIATSAAAAGILVWLKDKHPESLSGKASWGLLVTSVVTGASSSIGSLGAAVAVEREYPKVLCGADSAQLTKVNSVMRAIDLSSQMLAPVVSGFLMTYASMSTAIAVQALYCVAVWLPECLLLYAAHRCAPALRQPKEQQPPSASSKKLHPLSVLLGCSGWGVYFQQSTLLAGVALALLYLTVLSLGFLMTSYLAWRGMSEATLSLFRAAGALSGLSATLVFHPIKRYAGLIKSGTVGISWQLICLLLGVTPVVITHVTNWGHNNVGHSVIGDGLGVAGLGLQPQNSSSSLIGPETAAAAAAAGPEQAGPVLYVLLCGLVASRMGLWLFDLVVTQLQQEQVPDNQLGTVSGVQASIQSFFEILSFVAGCVVNKPEHFHWLMSGSCCAVASAAALYAAFAARDRISSGACELGAAAP